MAQSGREQGAASVWRNGWVVKSAVQTWHLLRFKEVVLVRRRWLSSVVQLLPPIFLLSLLFILQHTVVPEAPSLNPPAVPFPSEFPSCSPRKGATCLDLVWGPESDPVAAGIVASFGVAEAKQRAFGSRDKLIDWVIAHPNTTSAAVYFNSTGEARVSIPSQPEKLARALRVEILTNSTTKAELWRPRILRLVQEQLMGAAVSANGSALTAGDLGKPYVLDCAWQEIPILATSPKTNAVQIGGASFVFTGIAFAMIAMMRGVVAERESGQRLMLKTMGVVDGAYWAAGYVVNGVLACVAALLTYVTGVAYRFTLFTQTNGGGLVLLLVCFGLATVPQAFFGSAMVGKSRTALIVGILNLVVGMNVVAVFASNSLIYLLWKSSVQAWGRALLLILLPPLSFTKVWVDMVNVTYGYADFGGGSRISARRFEWADMHRTTAAAKAFDADIDAPPIESIYMLLASAVVYAVATWYADQVFSTSLGLRRPFYFFERIELLESDADDVAREMRAAASMSSVLSLVGVVKVFQPSLMERVWLLRAVYMVTVGWMAAVVRCATGSSRQKSSSSGPVRAVDGLYLSVGEGELVALLGHNGAGKTTAMSIVTGGLRADSGVVRYSIDGVEYSVAAHGDEIHGLVSICRQADVLWDELSAAEHVALFCVLSGVDESEVASVVDDALARVSLGSKAHERAGTFSGGMKRRLSVVLALVGPARMVLLDEPTTGLDPLHRREVWEMIEEAKAEKSILLTTHSMEEADALGDRIAIVSAGRLMAIGDAMELKSRYGLGYHVKIMCAPEASDAIEAEIIRLGGEVHDAVAGSIAASVPRVNLVAVVARYLEERMESGSVVDFAVSHTTLEEVFLRTARLE
ncbi:ATP-binding cassette transporter [Thecamonas trahens ATCC 50062]|uniref:ATP-binding cassette transporter n=1 Tax=Thecamonas trahens ATCC 50062 TaxID=461836 RepID=A0A0L0DKH0_THETB|nr:ATP-binding cassette transporter [Thecamonas trahens ATCC 50062]KNC52546.1 ATP-binding cassette transporter [Thecamonas trahens ATCC 50062]|eukprot:XP_013755337.1 ATP-binding cassette transporter [Thecamonas trahens ATCC 50062]